MDHKLTKLTTILGDLGSALVAYSGGVDSAFLAAVAQRVLGHRALCVTAVSPSYPRWELEDAVALAQELGLNHRVVETHEAENPDYLANTSARCFFCKVELYDTLAPIAQAEGLAHIIDGFNYDDRQDFRPGHKAGSQYGVRSPLFEAELTKAEIRDLSKALGLRTWDKPAMACLSSRVPYGTPIDLETLRRIEAAEGFLRTLGFRQLRVRHHGAMARIEVPPEDMVRFLDAAVREPAVQHLRRLGYAYVSLDLVGYRTGSLNEVLSGTPRRNSAS
ncbi:MAG: ATP-dependent sacrificial sulfur transferase LarE [Chloroflexi bacterium]|nr:ATP-dependent sacrificial sulfur transferase LarE [Chloroflexota bacterium]